MSEQGLQKSKSMFDEIRTLIEQTRQQVAVMVNSAMTMLYWRIGRRINREFLQERRAEYGKQIISTLSRQLRVEYGSGWSEKQLRHCLRIVETFPDEAIVSALGRQLSDSGIHVAEYLIELPPLELLRDKLHKAIETARNRISDRNGEELE